MIWAATSGILFGLFQVANRVVNQRIDAYRGTFRILMAALFLLALAMSTRDLSVVSQAGIGSWLAFATAGLIHFYGGWTFLSLSQQRIGAARTGAALATTPVIGTLLAALLLGERIGLVGYLAVALVAGGVALLATRHGVDSTKGRQFPWLALVAAACWGTSPIFIRLGLDGLPDPVVGVTVGVAAAVLLYALTIRRFPKRDAAPGNTAGWVLLAGLLVASALAAQWISFELIEIGIAIALIQLAAPIVVITAPLVLTGEIERVTSRLVVATIMILAGSVVAALS